MASAQRETPGGEPTCRKDRESTGRFGGEICLIDYLRVIWAHRRFVVLASVLPAVAAAVVLALLPRDHTVIYTYDVRLDEKGYKVLLDRFYSQENLDGLVSRFKGSGLAGYARRIALAPTDAALKRLVSFRVLPSYFDALSAPKKINVGDVAEIEQVKGTLLTMRITGRPLRDMEKISSIIRDDFEKVVPAYSLRHQLNQSIAEIKARLAEIEGGRFELSLELDNKKATSAKLKSLKPADADMAAGSVVLQLSNVGATNEFLPFAYQIQVVDGNVVRLEERMNTNEKHYAYYKELLSLNQRLFEQMRAKTSSYYTIQEFHAFLTEVINDCKSVELKDYLSAYIKMVENMVSTNTPVIEKPKIYAVSRGILWKTATVFAALSIMAMFGVFLLEGAKGRAFRAA